MINDLPSNIIIFGTSIFIVVMSFIAIIETSRREQRLISIVAGLGSIIFSGTALLSAATTFALITRSTP